MSDAIENDRFEPYVVHSAEDFYGVIAKYQLLDEVPTVPTTGGLTRRRIHLLVRSRAWC